MENETCFAFGIMQGGVEFILRRLVGEAKVDGVRVAEATFSAMIVDR